MTETAASDPFGDALKAYATNAPQTQDPFDQALQHYATTGKAPDSTSADKSTKAPWYQRLGLSLGHTAMDVGGMAAHAAGNLTDVVTGTDPGAGSHAEQWSAPFQHAPDQSDTNPTDPKELIRRGLTKVDPYRLIPGGPLQDTLRERIPQAVEAISTVAPAINAVGGRFASAAAAREASAIEEGHALTPAAKAESAEMQKHASAAEQAGLTLPTREVSTAQHYIDNAARRDLNLPKNSPITSGLLDAARKENVTPAYDAAKSVPEFQLGPKYQEAIKGIDLEKLDAADRPPISGSMTGKEAVDLSQKLRHEASAYWDYSEGAGGPDAKKIARAYTAAYKAVEAGFKEGATAADETNAGIIGNWEKARTYAAKTFAWEDTLDGAGHSSGPKVKKLMLQGEPISGPMKEAASVVAQYPELFKSTRLQTPAEGLIKRGARALAPVAGAAIGSSVAPGYVGPAGGAALGELISDRMLGPRR